MVRIKQVSKMKIIVEPNEILHQKCAKVKNFDSELEKLAQNMTETLFANNGVGLAAPQIGKAIKMIVIEFNPERFKDQEDEDKNERQAEKPIPLTILVNPKIISFSVETETQEEGCLSLPKIEIPINRALGVKVLAQDIKGNRIKIKAKGLFARALQHEIDHLEGILITDKK